jgi:hypothetical protein
MGLIELKIIIAFIDPRRTKIPCFQRMKLISQHRNTIVKENSLAFSIRMSFTSTSIFEMDAFYLQRVIKTPGCPPWEWVSMIFIANRYLSFKMREEKHKAKKRSRKGAAGTIFLIYSTKYSMIVIAHRQQN